jgi:hypothetical protein
MRMSSGEQVGFRRQASPDSESLSEDDLIDLTGTRNRDGPRSVVMPRRQPPLPKLWTEIEHLSSKQSIEVCNTYGPLAGLLLMRISKLNLRIFDGSKSEVFSASLLIKLLDLRKLVRVGN